MRKSLRIFALLTAASMLIWIAGCGEDEEVVDKGPAPKAQNVSVSEKQQVAGNAAITVTFSKKMGSVDISVSGATGTTVLAADGKSATWTPSPDMPAGPHTVTITGEDTFGQALEGAVPINITAIAPDTTKPALDDAKSDPKNGADGVDPADYPEKLTIVFNEALSEAKVDSTDPEMVFKTPVELSADGTTVEIVFMKWQLANETEYKITLKTTDLAGNEATLEYSFTTMMKAQ